LAIAPGSFGDYSGDPVEIVIGLQVARMEDITLVLSAIEQGDPTASDKLLPLVYEELRKLAHHRLAGEKSGQTLQATALVHEAYLRLVGTDQNAQKWNGRGHFFSAAAIVMRRILVENARRKNRLKHGGEFERVELDTHLLDMSHVTEDLLALDSALNKLATTDRIAADLVQLRYFAGLSFEQAGQELGMSTRSAERMWAYARAWLRYEMRECDELESV
jgi:RNA polymerase sigma factor (TIGR02999 family)